MPEDSQGQRRMMHLCIHITQGLSSSKKWEENFAMHFVVSVSMMRPLQRKSGSSAAQSLTLRFACFMRGRVNELRPGRMDLEGTSEFASAA